MSVKSSVHLGTAARSMDLLGNLGVKENHVQATVDNPIRRAIVASAYKGDTLAQISFDDVLAREASVLATFHDVMDQTIISTRLIERALRQTETAHGAISVNDRFIPRDLTLDMLFQFIYNWNAKQVEDGQSTLKLYHEKDEEWWRTNKNVESISTRDSIITCDFNTVMRATDMAVRPFNLGVDNQIVWAKEQGGDGIMTAEEVVYLFVRSLIENQLPLWGCGSIRCGNTYGSGRSLCVYFCVDEGFYVDYCDCAYQLWDLGALPGKLLVLVP